MPWQSLQQALLSEETRFATLLSLQTSLLSLLIALCLGVPAAWLMARQQFAGKVWLETLLDIPLVTPPLVAGVGLLFLLGHRGTLGSQLAQWGIEILFSTTGILLAQIYVAASIIVRTARAAFAEVDADYARMAWTLGLPPLWSFLLVEVPMAGRGLAAAAVLGWARALGEFGATLMLAGATRMKTETLPMSVFLNISSGETGLAVASAAILLVMAFVLLLLTRLLARRRTIEIQHDPHPAR
ncbi:ABC transporter permease [Oceanobacter mangrovi]|uniref:ABC transporter permease n=1 Tax=Oceanobacter mangrovi TaxID=2862510 RepID=UPI003CCEE9EB